MDYWNIVVVPSDPETVSCQPRAHVTSDDILIEDGDVAHFSYGVQPTAMDASQRDAHKRRTAYSMEASRGEVVRLYLTNTANVRTFNLRIPDARMKIVGEITNASSTKSLSRSGSSPPRSAS